MSARPTVLSKLSARICEADPTLTSDDLRKFVDGVAVLAGTIGADAGGAFDDMHDHLATSILALIDLSEDEQLRSSLKMGWLVNYSQTMLTEAGKAGGTLPEDLGARKAAIAQRKDDREALIVATVPKISALLDPIFAAAQDIANERLASLEAPAPASGFPAPEAQRYGVSARGAEFWVADCLRWLGISEAEVTQQGGDGGVDILANSFAVSVKHYAGAIPVEEVREIYGVATALRKVPMLWTSGTLTAAGAEFADIASVAVFRYEVETASIVAVNRAAQDLVDVEFDLSGV